MHGVEQSINLLVESQNVDNSRDWEKTYWNRNDQLHFYIRTMALFLAKPLSFVATLVFHRITYECDGVVCGLICHIYIYKTQNSMIILFQIQRYGCSRCLIHLLFTPLDCTPAISAPEIRNGPVSMHRACGNRCGSEPPSSLWIVNEGEKWMRPLLTRILPNTLSTKNKS